MDEYREPQQPASVANIYPAPPAYASAPVPAYALPKASRFLRARRTLRLLLRRMLRGGIIAGRALRPYALFAVVVVGLLGVIGWMSFMLWGPAAAPTAFSRADSLPPAAAVETFIQGQKTFNADIMWDAYSTQYQASQLASGASKATLQAQADNLRNIGLEFLRYEYIGGVKEDSGGIYFYTVDLRVRNQQRRFPIIFHADADGKITEIESVLAPQNGASSNTQQ